MSAVNTHVLAGAQNRHSPTDEPSAVGPGEPVGITELIASVLGRAHRTAENQNASSEARAILHVAHSFADELAITNPQFDRSSFIRAATGL
jgi:hypothetical protein